MTVAIALFTSPGWTNSKNVVNDPTLCRVATTTTALVYIQILIGATMRHTGAGLAIPDFPWMFGHVIPDHWSRGTSRFISQIVLGALVVLLAILATAGHVRHHHPGQSEDHGPATLMVRSSPSRSLSAR